MKVSGASLADGTASGDVVGPASATDGNLAVFDGATGKIIKDGGAIPAGASGANPTASLGLTAVNGVAATFMRSDGAPALNQGIVPTWTGAHAFSKAGAASLSAVIFTGAILTGGTGTTNFPHLFVQPAGTTAQTNWSTAGTVFGVNLANGYAGNFIHCQTVGNVDLFKVASDGSVTCRVSITLTGNGVWNSSGLNVGSGSQYLAWGASTIMTAATNGTILMTNNAASAGIVLRFTTDNQLDIRNRANSAGATVTADNLTLTASLTVGTSIQAGAGSRVVFSARGGLGASADGAFNLFANNGTTPGSLTLGPLITTPQALSGAGAVDVVSGSTAFTSTGAAQALTLANGTAGQIKTICHVVDGGSGVLTPTTKSGYTTITFTNVGDSVTLQYHTTAGWCIIGIFGAVAA